MARRYRLDLKFKSKSLGVWTGISAVGESGIGFDWIIKVDSQGHFTAIESHDELTKGFIPDFLTLRDCIRWCELIEVSLIDLKRSHRMSLKGRK